MRDLGTDDPLFTPRSAFRLYLRTGRRVRADRIVEVKFNPNHDPRTGQFTFKGGGGSTGGGGASGSWAKSGGGGASPPIRTAASRPGMSVYTVRPGDTLTHVAATRVGLKPADVATLNHLPADAKLKVGQELVIPTQESLDRAKQGFDTAQALTLYMRDHGGRLAPNVAHPPSVEEQILGPGARRIVDNGYTFDLDGEGRTRIVSGRITLNPDQGRSRENQRKAGGADRLPKDEGGHYVARRFNGPTAAYNHFAQDQNFNRGEYRKLENIWAKTTGRGGKVSVRIASEYDPGSSRPYELVVSYTIAGASTKVTFPNRRGDR